MQVISCQYCFCLLFANLLRRREIFHQIYKTFVLVPWWLLQCMFIQVMTVILFTTSAPHPLGDELTGQGHCVYEALAISEVLGLAEQHPEASILITADVDH